MTNPLAGAADAVRFLTVLPIPGRGAPRPLAAGLPWFPLVGAGIGAVLGGIGLGLDRLLPPGPVGALLLAASVAITGGLHLDGLMDTADGVFGGRTPARRLEIMRDSRVGAFGVMAGALAMLLQWACLAELRGDDRLRILVVSCTTARWAMVGAVVLFPAARAAGLGATMRERAGRGPLLAATVLAVIVAVASGEGGVVGFAVAGSLALVAGWYLSSRLGGLTGDTYGAVAVLAETTTLLAMLAARHGLA